jgi:MoxR-like ATPase
MDKNVGIKNLHYKVEELSNELAKVVVGRKKELKLILTALLAQGHVLLEDLPGTGKTTMVKAFSKGTNCEFSRIQCTPDLLPSDVLGGSIFNPRTNEFSFRRGPVFTNVLLVDEINRTLPRTQSSLLESMEEGQVSIEGKTYTLSQPFIVLATQNPIDMEGTFPLPEAQLDRFLMKLRLGYPTPEEEEKMLEQVGDYIPYESIQATLSPEEIIEYQKKSMEVHIHPSIREYITSLANATRNHPQVSVGVSPRASKAMYRTIKAWAMLGGRNYVIPDDVKELVKPLWSHRLILRSEAHINNLGAEDILEEILTQVNIADEKVVSYE